jgi:hypothetical protein
MNYIIMMYEYIINKTASYISSFYINGFTTGSSFGWIFLLLSGIIFEIYRYIKYLLARKRLDADKPIIKSCDVINHHNMKKTFQDLEEFPELLEDMLCDLFYRKIKPEEMNFENACEGLFNITGRDEQYKTNIKRVVKLYQLKERSKGRNVLNGQKIFNTVSRNARIHSWFPIFPINVIGKLFNLIIELYMRLVGFKYRICEKSGVKIWHNQYKKEKGIPLVFFHASVGGVSLHFGTMKYYHDTCNIILPEIPGVSFLNVVDRPPTSCQIIDDVCDFIENHYVKNDIHNDIHYENAKVDMSKLKINVMGHSLGNTLCCAFINKHPEYIQNFFCVEGHIFFPRSLRVYADFEKDVFRLPYEDLITVPFFHRDLYVQYFIKKLNPDAVFLFDMNDQKQHIKIHMYHSGTDSLLPISPQLDYAKKKGFKINYHIFEGDYTHGSFVLNSSIRQYVTDDIKKIYDHDEQFKFEILLVSSSDQSKITDNNLDQTQIINSDSNQTQTTNHDNNQTQTTNHDNSQTQIIYHDSNQTQTTNHYNNQTQIINHDNNQTQIIYHDSNQTQITNHDIDLIQITNHDNNQTQITNHDNNQTQITNHGIDLIQTTNHDSNQIQTTNHDSN